MARLFRNMIGSVTGKVFASLSIVFLFITVATIATVYHSEKSMSYDMARQRVDTMSYFYIDMMNLMMINDEMEDRDLVKQKVMAQEGVLDVRMIRHPIMNTMNDGEFAPGPAEQKPKDELERQSLEGSGQTLEQIWEGEDGQVLTIINPFYALADYRGTDCLGCHKVDDGTLVGTVRIDYSLKALDEQIFQNILKSTAIQLLLFLAGFGLFAVLIRTVVTGPLNNLMNSIVRIEKDSDLVSRVEVDSRDEFGKVGRVFNRMMEFIHGSMEQVSEATEEVNEAVGRINQQSKQTVEAIEYQTSSTEQVATAIAEMEQSSLEVSANAAHAAKMSDEANALSLEGIKVAEDSIQAISSLAHEVENAAMMITKLNDKTSDVGSVLGVIKSIAEQTNLLALNAAIEAARAGEHGRGFAVVADEVRALSKKTHDSAREIEDMIASLQKEADAAVKFVEPAKQTAENGINQVQRAVDSLREIADKIAGINELNHQMAVASDEQNRVTQDINHNVLEIKSISEETASHSKSNQQQTEQLLALVLELNQMIKQFKL
ncbi:methyl-accepting chemotaxis protein [Shewanella sedimentimangrovi]|uniref:Methyl-accepting chemotaxis protein n=1 Tax=Shewanella sedimentimangrovi TaxID=2814293 RepID=A0ABX7QZP5_9GAMM|nr:methyl-accepting chemotaxis protein [Shewanella sedimentimangrovi]QSX36517.1 methyl-accepting chemotaxis protein [Shewanella sedimentimangrovi]